MALKGVTLQDGAVRLFDGVDLAIETRARACLVGRNGAGKSTLLRLIAGEIEPDEGSRFIQPGLRCAFVPQEPEIEGPLVIDHVVAGGAARHEAEAALLTFGLDGERSAVGLSGGEIRRAALARAFAESPDLILLDEPTNHLDIFAIETLETEIGRTRAAVLVVSHDRAFLARITSRCFWLAHRKVRALDAGFSAFEPWAEQAEAEEAEKLRRLEKAIERETYTFYRSITAQRTRNEGRARALDAMRLEKAAILKDQTRPLELAIDDSGASGRLVVEAKGLGKRFAGRTVLENFSTRIMRGDRVAVVGPNGAGKTTLVKMLLGALAPDEGAVRLGSGLEVVYLDQAREDLRAEMTLWEALTPLGGDSLIVRGRSVHVAAYAKDFLFRDGQLRQPVASLSGGERNRLLLARALARPANLLVLDEPTNDLDMETLELLEELLADYEGTLILVSHDRDFINRLATSTIALDGAGRAVEAPGGWSDLLRQHEGFFRPRGSRGAGSGGRAESGRAAAGGPEPGPAGERGKAKLSFKDERRLKLCEEEMASLPGAIAREEARLEDAGFFARDPKGFEAAVKGLEALRARLARAEEDWLHLEERRAALLA